MKRPGGKNICAIGWYAENGARHWVIRSGLQEAGFTVTDHSTYGKSIFQKLIGTCICVHKERRNCDVLLVPFQGHHVMPLAWLLGKLYGKPVVFDVFISLYDSMVCDRGLVKKHSFKAMRQRWIDRISCACADVLLIDTDEHAEYFTREYGVAKEKFVTVLIGCRTDLFRPREAMRQSDRFEVLFHGTFIPLQGIDVIIRSAALLKQENIVFTLIGKGQTFDEMQTLARTLDVNNVRFEGTVPLEDLPQRIADADVCLGIFGTSEKTDRVIPHKAYEIIACGKPLITGDSRSARTFFTDDENAVLTAIGSTQELATAITELKNNAGKRMSIAENGRRLFLEKCAPRTIVSALVERLNHD